MDYNMYYEVRGEFNTLNIYAVGSTTLKIIINIIIMNYRYVLKINLDTCE